MDTRLQDLSRFPEDVRRRIEITTRVRATDGIRKVANAGQIETRDGVDVQVMHNGIVVEKDCYYGSWMTEVIERLRGHHEPQEELAFHALVEVLRADTDAPVMVELGSFWGYYSLWLKHEIPEASVVLVEPDPNNLRVGIRNFELNGLLATAHLHAAVGPEHSATVRLKCESDALTREIRTVTLDGLMVEERLPRIDLLLCDAQGAETDMLHGAVEAIRNGRVRFMVISTHWFDERPLVHQTCCALVERLGGRIIADHAISESCSGDGLIVVSFDARDRELRIDLPIVRARESLIGELEWHLARRVGWRGVLRGVVGMLPASTLEAMQSSRAGRAVRTRVFRRQALLED